MNRVIIICAVILNINSNCFAQTNNRSLIGVYGECKNIYNCFQIKINEDKSFIYYINEYVPGVGIAKGTWAKNNDTLMLYIEMPKEKTVIEKSFNNDLKGKVLTFNIIARDTLPIDSGKIIINNQEVYWTNKNGQIRLDEENIRQIVIDYPFIQDSTFELVNYNANVIDFYIPMGSTELIYQQPERWLIQGKYLIPIWFKDGNYVLTRERSIKKVPKRKVLLELR